ncbi:pimeloyl-ACP methyl ester esterase BioH [Catenovulum sediminis]|uniref:Pimeloyl-[acyl-carrier protein] methyl ester esterase n=1 Tax=Catenovulum sediminis TaxID=1740262 RepID=A0ABV1RDA5_9ALTE
MKSHLYFIHGWGMNRAVWRPIAEKLSHLYDVTLLDLPGYGESIDNLPQTYNLDQISQQVAQNIQQPGIIIGWSLGGLVAQNIALKNKEKTDALITIASTPCFAQKNDWQGIQAHVLTDFQQQLAEDYNKTLERFLAIQAMGSRSARQDIKAFKALLLTYAPPAPAALSGGLQILAEADLTDKIAEIHQPTVRLYGKLDSLVPKAAIDPIHQLQPHSDKYIFNKASHAPFISHPEEFLQVLSQKLSGLT